MEGAKRVDAEELWYESYEKIADPSKMEASELVNGALNVGFSIVVR